ncbi:MAG: sigma-70 family RNA polymerase sigma factor [Eubacterium sp.]|nr:sigma-70 family RNA polymerase sigma factor [Eubacterium sp.]
MDDSYIIDLFNERSESAVSELSKKYGPLCRSIAQNILKSREDAEECVNDAYLSVWNTIPPQKPASLSAYVGRIVRNKAVFRYRKNTAAHRNSYYDAALDDIVGYIASVGSVEDKYDENETAQLINGFLAELDKESRMIFLMRYWAGYSVKDVAKSFDMTSNNAAVKLSRIKERLKRYLEEKGVAI